MNIFTDINLIFTRVEQLVTITFFKYMAGELILFVEIFRVLRIEVFHNNAQWRFNRFQLEVGMVGHQAVGMEMKGVTDSCVFNKFQMPPIILLLKNNELFRFPLLVT